MKTIRETLRAAKRLAMSIRVDIIQIIFVRPKPQLPEDRIPIDRKGKPGLSYYSEPLPHYIDLYNSFLRTRRRGASSEEQKLAWKQRVHGTWGLFVKGQEALPYLLTLIRHPNPDAREDGSYLLGRLKLEAGVSEQLLGCLQKEQDLVAKSSMIEALGRLRYRPAIPAIASLVLNKEIDIDTRWNAADSLAQLVRQDFSGPDKLLKAEAWLAAHPTYSAE